MGRNNKIDLRYFPVDVDILRDKKVRRLTRKYARGAEFYLYLLCAIYSDKGYYMPIDDGTAFDIADDMRVAEAEIDEMMDFCMSDNVGLFSREMKDKYHILTSRGIQRRYAETIRQLKRKVSINPEYSLINSENAGNSSELFGICRRNPEEIIESSEENMVYSEEMTVNSEGTGINSDKSKVKESKVEESREEGYTHTVVSEKGVVGGNNAAELVAWINENVPTIASMPEPITETNAGWMLNKYPLEDIRRLIFTMHSKQAYLNNVNAYATFVNYAKLDKSLKIRPGVKYYTYEEMCSEIPIRAKGEDFERIVINGRAMWRKKIYPV